MRTKVLFRVCLFVLFFVLSKEVLAHHFVTDVYDPNTVLTYEVQVKEFQFINPHPFIKVNQVGSDELWILEMDNKWELAELGFDKNTLKSEDTIKVFVNASPFNSKAFYVRAMEHPRLGFRYEHNVRELYKLE